MTSKQHWMRQTIDRHAAAVKAEEEAHALVEGILETAIIDFSEWQVGDCISGKTSAGGIPCLFVVTEVTAHINDRGITIGYHGKKVKKDGTPANIECYLYEDHPMTT